mgnify:CR=1 FL=1
MFVDVIRGWQEDATFRVFFNALLANAPYSAFRWETPAVTSSTVMREFEFVLLNSPGLARPPDPNAFAAQFAEVEVDVELGTGGLLSGSLVNAQGQPRASTQVQIFREADLVGEATSNRDGQFQVAGLSGGVHQVRTLQAAWVCRLWAEETAPPGAATRALFVIDSTVVRGQRPLESLLCVDPLLIGAVVATAIAVPVIVHNTRHDRGSGS